MLLPHRKKVLVQIHHLARAFLCADCILSLCLSGFSLASPTIQRHPVSGVRLIGASKFPIGVSENIVFLSVLVRWQTENLTMVHPAFCPWMARTGSKLPHNPELNKWKDGWMSVLVHYISAKWGNKLSESCNITMHVSALANNSGFLLLLAKSFLFSFYLFYSLVSERRIIHGMFIGRGRLKSCWPISVHFHSEIHPLLVTSSFKQQDGETRNAHLKA